MSLLKWYKINQQPLSQQNETQGLIGPPVEGISLREQNPDKSTGPPQGSRTQGNG